MPLKLRRGSGGVTGTVIPWDNIVTSKWLLLDINAPVVGDIAMFGASFAIYQSDGWHLLSVEDLFIGDHALGDLLTFELVEGTPVLYDTSTTITLTETTTFRVHMWGGGGGGYFDSAILYNNGGGGGYAYGDVVVLPAGDYIVKVGGGGACMSANAGSGAVVEGGGGLAASAGFGGQGGGLSGIFYASYLQANAILIAGGGGGAGYCGSDKTAGSYGGSGGGLVGGTGGNPGAGSGGTQTGSAGYGAGTPLQGGFPNLSDYGGGGGGGGGYWGGGAGSNGPSGGPAEGGGGGGSGYINDAYIVGGVLTIGNGRYPGNPTQTYIATSESLGTGGTHNAGKGTHGRVVMIPLT